MRYLIRSLTSALFLVGVITEGPLALAQSCTVPLANKTGDSISVTGKLSSTDPNENGEGEPLIISSTGGELNGVVPTYFVPQTFTYTATKDNETITGTIIGTDGDESCSVTATANQQSLFSPAQKHFFAGAATGLAIPAAGFWTLSELCAASFVGGPVCALPSGLVAAGFASIAALAGLIAFDPPDTNFTEIATPEIPQLPQIGPQRGISKPVISLTNDLVENQAIIVGIEQALYTTLNRASGASSAGNNYWLEQQSDAAQELQKRLNRQFRRMTKLLTALQIALKADGIDVSITPAQVLNFELTVASSGLPPSDVSALQQFNADPTLIAYIRNLVTVQDVNAASGNLSDLFSPTTLSSLLTTLAQDERTGHSSDKGWPWQNNQKSHLFDHDEHTLKLIP